MKFKIGDKVKIRKNVTLEEIANNHFNGCQSDTMKFLLNASFNNFDGTFVIEEIWTDNCVELNNGFLVNTITLDKVEEILDDKEKEYLASVIKPFKNRTEYIELENSYDADNVYIIIHLEYDDAITLPNFEKDTMYKNMKVNKKYTLKELGLDE